MKIIDIPTEVLEVSATDHALRERLRNWRDWCRSHNRSHLFFPPASPIVRLMTPDPQARRLPRVELDQIDAWKIECAITALGVPHPMERQLLIVQYFMEHLPKETRRKAMVAAGWPMGQSRYYEILKASHGLLKKILTSVD